MGEFLKRALLEEKNALFFGNFFIAKVINQWIVGEVPNTDLSREFLLEVFKSQEEATKRFETLIKNLIKI